MIYIAFIIVSCKIANTSLGKKSLHLKLNYQEVITYIFIDKGSVGIKYFCTRFSDFFDVIWKILQLQTSLIPLDGGG